MKTSMATELVRGAVDLHTHSYPEMSLDLGKRTDDLEWAIRARDAGMGAIVLKSHLFPTMGSAYYIQQQVPEIPVFGSIALNPTAGGVDPWVVEAAARLGARVAFMPTWSAAHDLSQNGFSRFMKGWFPRLGDMRAADGLKIVDDAGKLLPNAASALAAAHAADMVVFTGHISPRESIALAEEARRIGFQRLVFSHPRATYMGIDTGEIHQMAELGAYIEICFLVLLPFQRVDPQQLVRDIREIGPERCIVSTDYFWDWSPPAPEMLRMFIGTLLQLGVSADEISTMVRVNPRKLLGLTDL